MKKNVADKREQEKKVIKLMIQLYCRKHHGKHDTLCAQCEDLYVYACKRIDRCPFMETKSFCSNCKVHCYQKDYRERVRQVMRFSGPRMMLYHPWMALCHLYYDRKEKKHL